jgi:hypothetical protein
MLYRDKCSGEVMFLATRTGRPTWDRLRLGTGDMKVLTVQSTCLLDKLPRNRPYLPFRR